MTRLADDLSQAFEQMQKELLSPEATAMLAQQERVRLEKAVRRKARRHEISTNIVFVILVLTINWIIWMATGWSYYCTGNEATPKHWAFILRENWLMFQVSLNVVWILCVLLFGENK